MKDDWMDINDQIQNTFHRGAEMTNISMVDDNEEGPLKMISIKLKLV